MRLLKLVFVTLIVTLAGASCADDSSTNDAGQGAGNQFDDSNAASQSAAIGLDQHAPPNDRLAPENDRRAPTNDRLAPDNDRPAPVDDQRAPAENGGGGGVQVAQRCSAFCSSMSAMGCDDAVECPTLCAIIATQICLTESTRLLDCTGSAESCDALEDCSDAFDAFVDCVSGGQVDDL